MTDRRASPLSVVLLTWVNLAVLLANFWLSSRHETSVMDTARSVAEQPGLVLLRSRFDAFDAAASAGEPAEVTRTAALDENEFERLVEAVLVEDRVRARVSALRQAMERLQQRGELSPISDASRSRIVALGRQVAAERARLERRLLAEDSLSLASWDLQIDTHDDRVRDDARRELQGIVTASEAEHLLRFVVPLRQSVATVR